MPPAPPPAPTSKRLPFPDWQQHPFFSEVPPALLPRVAAHLREEHHADGAAILREGDPPDRLCLLLEGRAAILKGDPAARLGTVEAGATVGEMGVLSGAPRSTTVVAETTVRLVSLSREALADLESETGFDLIALSLKAQAGVLGERLARTNAVAAESMRERLEEFRLRVAFGRLFTNVVLMVFVYTSALGLLRALTSAGTSSTLTTSALLALMAAGAVWIMKTSGFPLETFGFTTARWRAVLLEALAWSAAFCAVMTAAKATLLHWGDGYAHLALISPWRSTDGPLATAVAYGLYTVLSPVQEFVARGLLQGSLQKLFTGRHVGLRAVIVANAIFSISHQHLGLTYALAVFIPGLFWGWLYHRQRSLVGVSVSHVIIGLWGTGVLDLAGVVG